MGEFKTICQRYNKKVEKAIGKELEEIAMDIGNESIDNAPYRTGGTIKSQRITFNGKEIAHGDEEGTKQTSNGAYSEKNTVIISHGGTTENLPEGSMYVDWAVKVHENPIPSEIKNKEYIKKYGRGGKRYNTGGYKYLESAFLHHKRDIVTRIAKAIREVKNV